MKSKINFTNIDLYSKKIGFFFNNSERIGSFFGFFLTILYIFISIILFIYQIIKTIQRKELKVYDTTIYSQEMPSIDVDINKLYFSFALENPKTADRFIDESIYTAKLAYIEQQKKNEKFVTIQTRYLDIERCNMINFGKDYQNLFVKDELINSYCIKNFNYTLEIAGSYKHEKISYIRITIYPCVNSTNNNYSCKPQEDIDYYLTSGYFSIVIKDFGLNPSNYSTPIVPTLQDLFTTVDKALYKNYILNFGLTEIHTDTGLINDNINKKKYLKFRKEYETFSFRDEADYKKGKSLILVQLRLEDTIFIQKRSYTKVSEIFSRIGGYMQLMNTIFLLISAIFNKINSEIKIIDSIFKFNTKENKIILKLTNLKDNIDEINIKSNRNSNYSSNKLFSEVKHLECENKSKNNLIIKENNLFNIYDFKISENKKNNEIKNCILKLGKNSIDNTKTKSKIENNEKKENNKKTIFEKNNYIDFKEDNNNIKNFKEHINLNIFEYFCSTKKSKKYKIIELYNKGNSFYREKMDISRVFTIITIIEDLIHK